MSEKSFGNRRASNASLWGDYVAVMFAESQGEAERCRSLLEQHGIPATLEADARLGHRVTEISVLVPVGRLDDATGLLSESSWAGGLQERHRFDVKDGPTEDDEDTDEVDDEDDEFDDEEEDDADDDSDDDDDDVFDDEEDDEFNAGGLEQDE